MARSTNQNKSNSSALSSKSVSDIGQPRLVARQVRPALSPLPPKSNPNPNPAVDFSQAPEDLRDDFASEITGPSAQDLNPPSGVDAHEVGENQGIDNQRSSPMQIPSIAERWSQPASPQAAPDAELSDATNIAGQPTALADQTHPAQPTQPAPSAQPTLKAINKNAVPSQVTRSGIAEEVPALSANQLTIRRHGQMLLDSVDFSVAKGELIGIAGLGHTASQALFEVILDLERPQGGLVQVLNHHGQQLKPTHLRGWVGWLRLHYAALRQDPWPLLGRNANCHDVLTHAARLLGVDEPEVAAARMETLMGLTGTKPPSYGWELPYRIRLNTALAFLANPEILLVDFPTRDLGPDNATWLWSALEQYQDDTQATIIVTSNDLAELERLCDRIILIGNARVVGDSSPTALAQSIGREDIKRDYLEPAGLDR